MLLSVTEFIGRFHPVVVHLPIGILLIAGLFQLASRKYPSWRPAIPALIFWGFTGAVLSCITGYMLSLSGDYDVVLTGRHQWMGIITAVLSLVFYFIVKKAGSAKVSDGFAIVMIGAISVTGHLGGSLTHGSGYLTESLGSDGATGIKPIPDVQEAILYTDIVQPVLKAKCYSCHGPSRQKGKLRLDENEYILKGGESGVAVKAGDVDESELIKRLLLPVSNEDHMPPKEKPQLSKNEIALLQWWVATGADFTKKVRELEQPEAIKPVLAGLQSGVSEQETAHTGIPSDAVAPADEKDMQALRNAAVMVMRTAKDNNYLTVNFITADRNADSLVELLKPLAKQLVWLRLDDADIGDEAMDVIGKLPNLTRLYLSNTKISDAGLAKLNNLKHLEVLNLVNTSVTEKGVLNLKSLPALRAVYLYKSQVDRSKWKELEAAFPKAVLDSGGYVVPTLVSDTTLVTSPVK